MKSVTVLGIRGIPACHGGFETFAEKLATYLTKNDWTVTVYCQLDGRGEIIEEIWNGIHLIKIPVNVSGPLGTILFDLISIWHSRRTRGMHLTLGYNTAIFNIIQRVIGITNIINMDGIEWKRQKWGKVAKMWFWLNERFGCWFGNHLIADHPRIEDHLATRVSRNKITMIPYGGELVTDADIELLAPYNLIANEFSVVIARPEPENSFLEIVRAFSQSSSNHKLVVLGNFETQKNSYHKLVIESAGDNVIFPGAIYDKDVVAAFRKFSRFYIHGHQVGGTNPSLVEALGASCAVIAHDNEFNRWVAGDSAFYFSSTSDIVNFLEGDYKNMQFVQDCRNKSAMQFESRFQWPNILKQYEDILLRFSDN